MLTVYHGATCPVSQPLCNAGRSNLDFGRGFYVTNLREQAVSWAVRPVNAHLPQWVNIYELDTDRIHATYYCAALYARTYGYQYCHRTTGTAST